MLVNGGGGHGRPSADDGDGRPCPRDGPVDLRKSRDHTRSYPGWPDEGGLASRRMIPVRRIETGAWRRRPRAALIQRITGNRRVRGVPTPPPYPKFRDGEGGFRSSGHFGERPACPVRPALSRENAGRWPGTSWQRMHPAPSARRGVMERPSNGKARRAGPVTGGDRRAGNGGSGPGCGRRGPPRSSGRRGVFVTPDDDRATTSDRPSPFASRTWWPRPTQAGTPGTGGSDGPWRRRRPSPADAAARRGGHDLRPCRRRRDHRPRCSHRPGSRGRTARTVAIRAPVRPSKIRTCGRVAGAGRGR